ncbi:DegT/DnrJ/EryC1/StrS family aminotransferase [soil metagenome]
MRVPFYDVKAQYDELASEIDAAVHGVVSSGGYVLGPEHNAFEREIAEYQGVRHAIGVANGTDAIRIALDCAGIGPGDEVITTAFTFVASIETIVQVGATPVLVDIEPETFQIDPALIEAAITERTKAIMPIHLFGQVCDMDAVMAIASRHGLVVIEDAAQAIGSSYKGVPAGAFGLVAGVSFYVTKNLGAIGDAGMILTNDDEMGALAKSYRIHGMGRERYYYDHIGYTSRLDEIQAAFMRPKLRRLDDWTARRHQIAANYTEGLANGPVTVPKVAPDVETTWHQYSVRSPQRDALKTWLAEDGIDSMIYYPVPLHFHEPYKRFAVPLPETERAAREILNLPIHPHLSDEQARAVVERIRAFPPSM